jgi:hypothetical protein
MRALGLMALCSAAVLLQSAFADGSWFDPFRDRVAAAGRAATLPPHLSLVLGLGDGVQPVPVKQAGKQDGHEVRTFNVVEQTGRRPVVLMDHDEQTQETRAFLLRPDGTLDRAVAYKTGGQPRPLRASQARAALRQQLNYWANEAGSKSQPARASH